ncbi:hypothetical protein GH714_000661 [Hevea brasiliensis]|uniref:Uncharacterized protein n=1 Tax=Hevea brasiliensis TaxID=3981 RepID=A0A6A6LY39_HEVBR|nr:hypothetical protein GH714_000661 [Hevea brasiliensis]
MVAPPVFDGEDYQVWAVRMEAFLEACDLWDAVEEDYEVPPLPGNPTVAQIKTHKERKTKKSKAKNCLFAAVSSTIFSKIMTLGSAKAIWDFLKNEYKGDERIKGMKVLNLVREFEMQHMKESETVKAYVDRLSGIANKNPKMGSELIHLWTPISLLSTEYWHLSSTSDSGTISRLPLPGSRFSGIDIILCVSEIAM